MAQSKFTYYMCFDIVKTPINPDTTKRRVWSFKSVNFDSASKIVKRQAQSNYESDYKTATLFSERGYPLGYAFRVEGEMIFVSSSELQSIGLIPRRK